MWYIKRKKIFKQHNFSLKQITIIAIKKITQYKPIIEDLGPCVGIWWGQEIGHGYEN